MKYILYGNIWCNVVEFYFQNPVSLMRWKKTSFKVTDLQRLFQPHHSRGGLNLPESHYTNEQHEKSIRAKWPFRLSQHEKMTHSMVRKVA